MKIFAIADPHLSLGSPDKSMAKFGPEWEDHPQRMAAAWRETVAEDDLVLIAGDISWAMRLEAAQPDLEFLGALPGTKVMIKGNHDYWWRSIGKVRARLPDRFLAIQGDAVEVNGVVICGTRLWDVPGVTFEDLIDWNEDPPEPKSVQSSSEIAQSVLDAERIYHREFERLERSLSEAEQLAATTEARLTIALTHYPPCDADLTANDLTSMFERFGVDHVVFGHLHNLHRGVVPFGLRAGISYHLTACDFLAFRPKLIAA